MYFVLGQTEVPSPAHGREIAEDLMVCDTKLLSTCERQRAARRYRFQEEIFTASVYVVRGEGTDFRNLILLPLYIS